jgi:transposase
MPKYLKARPPLDSAEEHRLRKLAGSKRAPAEQVARARTIVQSWDGADTATIATRLGCHPQTVRDRISRFNATGVGSIVDVSSGGRRPRLTESQRRDLVAMVERLTKAGPLPCSPSPAPARSPSPPARRRSQSPSLDAFVDAAHQLGIEVGRSHLRRILLEFGLEWHPTQSWRAVPKTSSRSPNPGDWQDVSPDTEASVHTCTDRCKPTLAAPR